MSIRSKSPAFIHSFLPFNNAKTPDWTPHQSPSVSFQGAKVTLFFQLTKLFVTFFVKK